MGYSAPSPGDPSSTTVAPDPPRTASPRPSARGMMARMSATTLPDAPSFDAPAVVDAIAAWMPTTRWYPLKGQQVDVSLEQPLGDRKVFDAFRQDVPVPHADAPYGDESKK